MHTSSSLASLFGPLQDRWTAMNSREQRMVSAMVAVVVLALFWLALVEPAWDGRARLLKDLPRLREQAGQVAGMTELASRLPKRVGTADLRSGLDTSLTTAGLASTPAEPGKPNTGAPTSAVTANPSGSVTVKLDKVVYSTAAAWAQRAARDLGAHIESASMQTSSESARVNAEFVFAR